MNNCAKISQYIKQIRDLKAEFDLLSKEEQLDWEKLKTLEKEIDDLIWETLSLEEHQFTARDKIAKKNGCKFVGLASAGHYIGNKNSKLYLISPNGELLSGACTTLKDAGQGTFFLQFQSAENKKISQMYFSSTKEIKDLELEEDTIVEYFIENQPALINYNLPGGESVETHSAFLTTEGEKILDYPGPSERFSDGFMWRKEGSQYILYDTEGKVIVSKNDFEHIGHFVDGVSIAAKMDTDGNRHIFTIDKDGTEKDLNIVSTEIPFRHGRYILGGDTRSHHLFWFTIDGKRLSIPVEGVGGNLSEKEGIFSIKRDEEDYYLVDEEWRKITEQNFKKVGMYCEGFIDVLTMENQWQYMDNGGNFFSPKVKTKVLHLGGFHDETAAIQTEDGWTLINKNGEDVCNGQRFKWIDNFLVGGGNGVIAVQSNDGSHHYMTNKGKFIFEGTENE